MTFEEFFKRKKIDLPALAQGEAGLFAEFKTHFEQMGEKSFDHTKKYWFNQLRRRFPTPPEVKVEKIRIENVLAEQTVTDELNASAAEPTAGFKPQFRAPAAAKPETDPTVTPAEIAPDNKGEQAPAAPPADGAKVGFKPRFKASMVSKPVEPAEEIFINATNIEEDKAPPAEPQTPKVGFKPRFKASMVVKAVEPPKELPESDGAEDNQDPLN